MLIGLPCQSKALWESNEGLPLLLCLNNNGNCVPELSLVKYTNQVGPNGLTICFNPKNPKFSSHRHQSCRPDQTTLIITWCLMPILVITSILLLGIKCDPKPVTPRNFPYPLISGSHFNCSIFLQQL